MNGDLARARETVTSALIGGKRLGDEDVAHFILKERTQPGDAEMARVVVDRVRRQPILSQTRPSSAMRRPITAAGSHVCLAGKASDQGLNGP
ncbi:hypothetical protein [Bradyrhizobium sp. CCBAU 51627]|uniref:hypothetical protein n=1 Tax=Bradyrhizobium sp. CCBAU 51627 TaxID=1325088 RepID=UPI002305DDF0|nr:hypothetical protein [Bradyrhizobium sp. CCBAU 51627]